MGDGVTTKVPYNPVYARGLFAHKRYGVKGMDSVLKLLNCGAWKWCDTKTNISKLSLLKFLKNG